MGKIALVLVLLIGCAEEKAAGPSRTYGGEDAGGVDVVVAFDLAVAPDAAAPAEVLADVRPAVSPDVVAVEASPVDLVVDVVKKSDSVGSVGMCPEMAPGAYEVTDCGRPTGSDAGTYCGRAVPVSGPALEPCQRWRPMVDGGPPVFLGVYVPACSMCAGVRL